MGNPSKMWHSMENKKSILHLFNTLYTMNQLILISRYGETSKILQLSNFVFSSEIDVFWKWFNIAHFLSNGTIWRSSTDFWELRFLRFHCRWTKFWSFSVIQYNIAQYAPVVKNQLRQVLKADTCYNYVHHTMFRSYTKHSCILSLGRWHYENTWHYRCFF